MSSKPNNRIFATDRVKEIITIDASTPTELTVKTCAYIRVSSNSEEQQASYASQFNTYTQMIRSNPAWEFAGVYADEGITGTDAEIRPEFQRMIADCKKGKIDRIIAKSISRFARNVPDLLDAVRTLSKIGVTLYFEKETLDTATIDNEMLLIVLASIAESESVSISQNQKFGIQHRMQAGTYIQSNIAYGYEYDEKKQPVILKSQAVVVQRIFTDYLSGKGYESIIKELNAEKIPAPYGNKWSVSVVMYILKNPFYIGDALWQKKYTTDTLPFRKCKNNGEKDQYLFSNHHPAIITRESFEKVQAIAVSRNPHYNRTPHLFSRKLVCPYCDRPMKKKLNTDGAIKWVCRTRYENAENCRLPILSNDYIQKTIGRMLQELTENMDTILRPLLEDYKEISGKASNQGEIAEVYAKITQLNEQAIVYAELKMQEIIDEEMYRQEISQIQYLIKQLRDRKNKITTDSLAHDKIQSRELLINFLSDNQLTITKITKETLELMEKIHINMDETITIYFRDSISITGGAEQ